MMIFGDTCNMLVVTAASFFLLNCPQFPKFDINCIKRRSIVNVLC